MRALAASNICAPPARPKCASPLRRPPTCRQECLPTEIRFPSVSVSKRRNGGFYAPVSASKISVPDPELETGSMTTAWGGWQFGPFRLHHPVRPNHGFPGKLQIGCFCGDIRRYRSGLSVSAGISGLLGRFWASRLCIQKFRSRRPDFKRRMICSAARKLGLSGDKRQFSRRVRIYCGLSPSASNCRPHSAGVSRSRSTPIPRGRQPSTAALTRSGARKASEMVMLT